MNVRHSETCLRHLACAAVSAYFAVSCGAANLISSSDEQPGEFSDAAAVRTLEGGTNVSDVPGLASSFESQTAARVIGSRAFIAYRAGDARFTHYVDAGAGYEDQVICAGTSQLSYSVGEPATGSYRRVVMDPPEGISALWGPVAMGSANGSIFLSALAAPEDRFTAAAKEGSCVRTSRAPQTEWALSFEDSGALAGACIAALPAHTLSCVRSGNDVFAGGSLASTAKHVYAAYRNVTKHTIALYRATEAGDFEPFAAPSVWAVDGDVLLAATPERLFLLYVTGSNIVLLRFEEATGTWEPPLVVAGNQNRAFVQPRKLGEGLAVRGLTVALLEGPGDPTLAVFWQRVVGTRRHTTLRGGLCETRRGGTCRFPTHLGTSNLNSNFLPSIASVVRRRADGTAEYRHFLSYWSDRGQRAGRVALRVAEFDEHRLVARTVPGSAQKPCALTSDSHLGDWGLSDESFVVGQNTEHPIVYRAFTDSTQGGCEQRGFRGQAQHVSVLPISDFE